MPSISSLNDINAQQQQFDQQQQQSQSSSSSSSPSSDLLQLPIVQKISNLCLWVTPLHSGLTLLCLLLLTFLLHYGYSVLTLFSYLLLLQLATCTLYINAAQFVLKMKGAIGTADSAGGEDMNITDTPTIEYISQQTLTNLLTPTHRIINSTLNQAVAIIRCKDNFLTLRVLFILLVLSILGRMFDGITLFFLCIIFSMTLPKMYQLNKEKCDATLEKLNSKVGDVWRMVKEKGGNAATGKVKTT